MKNLRNPLKRSATNKQTNKQTDYPVNKLRCIVLLLCMAFLPFGLKAQIKIDSNGKVGLHSTTTSTSADVLIMGSARIQNSYGGYVYFGSNYSAPEIRPGTATTGSLGTSNYPFSELRAYYVRGYYLYNQYSTLHASDQRLKDNFRIIESPLNKVLLMNGQKYDYISEPFDTIGDEKEKQKRVKMKKDKLGFVAQELKEILPEAVVYEEDEDRYYIDYDAIIPVLTEAIKEQQTTIEELTARIEALESKTVKEKSASLDETAEASLSQNTPNPFSSATTINMYLPETVTKAVLYIYTMQGEQVKSFDITERGNTSVTIEGYTLKAGMYLYTLITDGREVDTKKMILTK
ncbi:MAG: tail fiber domain-containing protein [Prolixibacteraceae bacterium]|nr:tail fiber domain-containing protein [Prolixibacteraceae bacterium]